MFPTIQKVIEQLDFKSISMNRKEALSSLIVFIQQKHDQDLPVLLNFICTHNSRRSQFAQIWAQLASSYYGITTNCYSGGTAVTSFNENAISSLKRMGFQISRQSVSNNPVYEVKWDTTSTAMLLFSKIYNDAQNPSSGFAAVLTCSDAATDCPYIPSCEKRIALPYEDPKKFDHTAMEKNGYDQCSLEIATQLFYVFSNIRTS